MKRKTKQILKSMFAILLVIAMTITILPAQETQAASNRETDKESWDVFDNLSKLSGTKLL